MNLEQMRAAAIKAAQAIIAKAKAENREHTADEVTELEAKAAEVTELDGKIAAAKRSADVAAKFAGLTVDENGIELDANGTPKAKGDGTGTGTKAKADDPADAQTLGEWFVKSGGVKSLESSAGTQRSVAVKGEFTGPKAKAATDTQVTGGAYAGPGQTGLLVPGFDTNVEMTPRQQPTIANLLGSGTTTLTALTYFVQGVKDGRPAATAELGRKPQVHYNWTSRTDTLKKIAGITKISDEAEQDIPYLVSEINGQLLYDLAMEEERLLLNGTGTDPEIQGLLNRSGIQSVTAVAADAVQDVVFRAMTQVQTATMLAPDGIVIHPLTYQALRLKRDGNGQYYGGGFFQGQYGNDGFDWQPPLWGMRTVVTAAVDVNTILTGNFRSAATVYRKGGIRLESTNSNEDDFEFNRITIRAEERLMLQVRRPLAIAKVNVAAATGN
jgi:HK97 family phage major capsid protein